MLKYLQQRAALISTAQKMSVFDTLEMGAFDHLGRSCEL